MRPFGGARLVTTSGSRNSPRSAFSIESAMRCGAAFLVLVAVEFARQRNGVERAAVGGGVDLRVDDVGAGHRAGAGDDRQQPGMIGREHGELGHRALGVESDRRWRGALPASSAARTKLRVLDLVRQIDLEPIGRIELGDIGVEPLRRPVSSSPRGIRPAPWRRAGRG